MRNRDPVIAATPDPADTPASSSSRAARPAIALVGASLLLAAVAGGAFVRHWLRTADSVASVTCVETVALTAIVSPGHPLAQHRHMLEAHGWHVPHWRPGPDGVWRPDLVVLNQRTGRAFRWGFRHTADGRTEYYVPTRYALLANRGWMDEPWALCRLAPDADATRQTAEKSQRRELFPQAAARLALHPRLLAPARGAQRRRIKLPPV
jgi:hypothetical protein